MAGRDPAASSLEILEAFDCVIGRSVATAADLCAIAYALLKPGGLVLHMRGRGQPEMPAGDEFWDAPSRHRLHVPFLGAQRHLDTWRKRRGDIGFKRPVGHFGQGSAGYFAEGSTKYFWQGSAGYFAEGPTKYFWQGSAGCFAQAATGYFAQEFGILKEAR